MQGQNPMNSGQAKALSARLVNAVPLTLTMEQADRLIQDPITLNDAISQTLFSLVNQPIDKTEEQRRRFTQAAERIIPALKYISAMDHPGLIGGIKEEYILADRVQEIMSFVFDYIAGKKDFLRSEFKIDLTPFGYVPYGKVDELVPESFSEITLVPFRSFIPERLKLGEDVYSWKMSEEDVRSSKACGQKTAEWILRHSNDIPEEWHREAIYVISFPANGWNHKTYGRVMCNMDTRAGFSTCLFLRDSGDDPTPREDSWVVCRI